MSTLKSLVAKANNGLSLRSEKSNKGFGLDDFIPASAKDMLMTRGGFGSREQQLPAGKMSEVSEGQPIPESARAGSRGGGSWSGWGSENNPTGISAGEVNSWNSAWNTVSNGVDKVMNKVEEAIIIVINIGISILTRKLPVWPNPVHPNFHEMLI